MSPKVEIACMPFKDGDWWWASLEIDDNYITSGYRRSRETAISQLKRKLERISEGIAYAQGFLLAAKK